MQRTIPPGKATGCLPRKSRPGEWCPLAGERIEVIPENQWEELAGEVNLRGFVDDDAVLDQDGVGSCATESGAGTVHVARALAGLKFVLLNPWFVYHTTSHGRDQGSSIDENLDFIRRYGVAPESVWPRSKGWRAKPSDEAVEAALKYRLDEFFDVLTKAEAVSCLLKGYALCYGADGHSVLKIAYLGGGRSLDLNSWGKSWKDGGFGEWASIDEINWGYGAFAVRSCVIGDQAIHLPDLNV